MRDLTERLGEGLTRARVLALLVSLAGSWVACATLRPGAAPNSRPDLPFRLAENGQMAVADGSVWFLSCDRCTDADVTSGRARGRLLRIDPGTHRVQASIPIDDPGEMAVGEGGVWITNFGASTLTRVDASTNRIAATVPLTLPFEVVPGDRRFVPLHVAVGDGAVWVDTARGAIARIDPTTNRVMFTVAVPGTGAPAIDALAVGDRAVWVAAGLDGLLRLDPGTGHVTHSVPPARYRRSRLMVGQMAVGGGAVWVVGTWAVRSQEQGDRVATEDWALAWIDEESDRVVDVLGLPGGGASVAFGGGAAWTVSGSEVLRTDPDVGYFRVTARLELPAGTRLVPADDGGAPWLVGADGSLRRVDTLPGARPPDCGVIDVGSDEYRPVLKPGSGTSGATVTISGPTLRGEDGRYAPASLIEAWWNTDVSGTGVPDPPPIRPGPVVLLGETRDLAGCRFDLSFAVPDVDPGTYAISVFVWSASGYGVFGRLSFDVLAAGPTGTQTFVPPTHREGHSIVMPVTFPEGTTAEILFPPGVDLAGMGLQPDLSYLWLADPPPRFPLSFDYGIADPSTFAGDGPIRRYDGPGEGSIRLWRANEATSDSGEPYWVVFDLGAWTILAPVPDPRSGDDVARGLNGHLTEDGFVVVEAAPPIALSRETGEGGGPAISLGDLDPRPFHIRTDTPRLVIFRPVHEGCSNEPASRSTGYASRCLAGTIRASIYGDRAFVDALFGGLAVRDVDPAS